MSPLKNSIVRETIHELGEDTKFIRLATVTMFIHSLIFTFFILRYARFYVDYTIVEKYFDTLSNLIEIGGSVMIPLIVIVAILGVGYYLLPPIGEAAMIIYQDTGDKQGTASLTKGINKFFPMFEFHAATGLFNFHVIIFAMMRMQSEGVLGSPIIVFFITLWFFISVFVAIFFSYSKMLITLEGESFFDAMKKSAIMTMQNLGITLQFAFITGILSIRFIINILLLVGIPLFMIYVGTRLGLDSIFLFKILFIIIVIGLILLVSYVEGIIEAFFITCWLKVWKVIKQREQTQAPIA